MSSSKRISIDTLGKTALKCGNLPSLKVIRPKRAKILPHKVAKVFRRLFSGGEFSLQKLKNTVEGSVDSFKAKAENTIAELHIFKSSY